MSSPRSSNPSPTSPSHEARKWNIHKPQYDAKGQKLCAMSRKYPVPEEQPSLDELLALPPLPRTFKYLLKDEVKKVEQGVGGGKGMDGIAEEEAREKRRLELENAKKFLRNLALGVK